MGVEGWMAGGEIVSWRSRWSSSYCKLLTWGCSTVDLYSSSAARLPEVLRHSIDKCTAILERFRSSVLVQVDCRSLQPEARDFSRISFSSDI